jgi:hypothetical protein
MEADAEKRRLIRLLQKQSPEAHRALAPVRARI